MTECDDLIVHREGGASVIPLNRPKVINAMTLEMSIRIDAALDRFEHDPDVAAIVLEGAGERGLCAGDDIRDLYGSSCAGISSGAPSLPERRFSRKHPRRRDR